MKFSISRDSLLKPLQTMAGIVERKQDTPILSNVLLVVTADSLTLTATNKDVEFLYKISLDNDAEVGSTTVSARKLLDICRALPEQTSLRFKRDADRIIVNAAKSRYILSTLPAEDFPSLDDMPAELEFSIPELQLRQALESVHFAMAHDDVRAYLNGVLFDFQSKALRAVTSDGHRLALNETVLDLPSIESPLQVIVPRKAALEVIRLLQGDDTLIAVGVGTNHLRLSTADFTFSSRLIEAKFPDYQRIFPKRGDNVLVADKLLLKQALVRAAVLLHEKHRGVRLQLSDNQLTLHANNPEQEQAEEVLEVEYQGEPFEIGFNVNYLLDVLQVITTDKIQISLVNADTSALLEAYQGQQKSTYVIMPMRI